MTSRDEAHDALAGTDWGSATVDRGPVQQPASMVFSVRVPVELAGWIAGEADRRAVSPSAVIRDAVAAAHAAAAPDQTVTVRLSDLHRAINTLLGPAA